MPSSPSSIDGTAEEESFRRRKERGQRGSEFGSRRANQENSGSTSRHFLSLKMPVDMVVGGDLCKSSCVVTHYNQADFISDCLSSLLQTNHPAEILVVDDRSAPEQRHRLAEICRVLPVRPIFLDVNVGVSGARMHGLVATSGEFVMFLDSDDILGDRYIAQLESALSANPSAAFALGVQHFFSEHPGDDERRWPTGPISFGACWDSPCLSGSGVLFRREVLLDVGGFRSVMGGRFEDWDLGLRLMLAGHHGLLVEDAVYHYRRHPGSSMDRIDARARACVDAAFALRYRAGLGSSRARADLLGRRFFPLLLGDLRAGRLRSAIDLLREARRLGDCGWAAVAREMPGAWTWIMGRRRAGDA